MAVVRIVEIVVEFVQHFRAWRGRKQRDHHDEQQRDDERRQQLVDGEDATERLDEVVPDEHGGRAGQHARDRAVLVGAPPVQRGEHQRSEGCAEAGPRVRDHLEDRGVLVERHHDAEDEHDEQRDARHHHHLAVGGLAVQQSAEDVLADGRGADDHVRGRGAHGRGEDAGHDDAAHEARQQRLRHHDEDVLRGRLRGELRRHHGTADQADAHAARQRDHAPRGGDDAGFLDFLGTADGQEPHEHLRHAEVAQAPREHGDDGDDAVVGGRAEHGLSGLDDLLAGVVEDRRGHMRAVEESRNALEEGDGVVDAAGGRHGADEHHGQREEHEQALDEVGHDHGQIAADDGVREHDGGADHHGQVVVPAEQRGEEFADGHEAAADVHAEEYEDDERSDGGYDIAIVMEALGEEVGNGDRVAGHHGVAAQTACDEFPVEVSTKRQTDGRPHWVGRAGEVGDARQAHKQPAAHVGGFRAQCRQPRSDATPTREILFGGGIGPLGVDEADGQHGREVQDHGQQHPEIFGYQVFLPFCRLLNVVAPGFIGHYSCHRQADRQADDHHERTERPIERVQRIELAEVEHGLVHIQTGHHDHNRRNRQADARISQMRSKQAVAHRRTPCGGEQAGKERADERAGFRGHAQVDDLQSQGIGDGADGGCDEAHALRRIEHHGEAPHTDEREQHAQQAVDDGVQSKRLESLRIQVHD